MSDENNVIGQNIENMSNSPNPEFSPENTSQAVTKTKTKNAMKR